MVALQQVKLAGEIEEAARKLSGKLDTMTFSELIRDIFDEPEWNKVGDDGGRKEAFQDEDGERCNDATSIVVSMNPYRLLSDDDEEEDDENERTQMNDSSTMTIISPHTFIPFHKATNKTKKTTKINQTMNTTKNARTNTDTSPKIETMNMHKQSIRTMK